MKTLSMSGLEPNFGEEDSYFAALRARKKTEAENYKKKVELSFDEEKVGKSVSEFFAAQLPEGTKINKTKHPTDFTAVSAAFADDDPRKNVMPVVKQNYQALLRNKEFKGANEKQLLSIAYEATVKGTPSQEIEGASFEDDVHRYKYKQDTTPFGMGDKVVAAPGYDEWLAKEKAKPMEDRQIGFGENVAWWTGIATAGHVLRKPVGEAIGRSLLKVGAEKAGQWMMRVAPPQGKLVGAVLTAAALSVPDTLASNAIRKTEWYRAREDMPIMRELAAMTVGGVVAGGVATVGAKQGMGALKIAAEKGAVTEAALKNFFKDSTAENIIRIGAARKAEKAALNDVENLLNNVAGKDEKKLWFERITADEESFLKKYNDDYAKESVIQMERNALQEELILKSPVERKAFGWGGEANQPTIFKGRATPIVRYFSNFEKIEPEFGWKGEGYTSPMKGIMPPKESGFPRFEVYPEGVARQTNLQLELPAGNQLALPRGGPGQQALPPSRVFGPKGQWTTVVFTPETMTKTSEGLSRKAQKKIFTSLDTDEVALVIDRVTTGKSLSDVLFDMQQTRALKAALVNTEKMIVETSKKTTILPPDNVTGYVGSDAAAETGKAGKVLTLTQEVAEAKGKLAAKKAAEQKVIQNVAKTAKKDLTDVVYGHEGQALLKDIDDPRIANVKFFAEGKTPEQLDTDAANILEFFAAKMRTNNVVVPPMSPERTAAAETSLRGTTKPKVHGIKKFDMAVIDSEKLDPEFLKVANGQQTVTSYVEKMVEDPGFGELEVKRIYNLALKKGVSEEQIPNTQIFRQHKAAQEKAHFIRGEVLDPVVDDITEFAGSSIADKGSLKAMIPIGAVGLTTVAAAIGLAPTDAEAAGMASLMKNVKALPKAWLHTVKELHGIKAIGHKQEMEMLGKVVKEMEESGFVVKQVGASKVLPARAVVPNYATLAKELYGSLEAGVNKAASGLGFGFERIMSPYSRAQLHYKTGANPMIHLAHTQAIWNANTDNAFQVFNNIMKDVKGGQSAAREIIQEFKPLAQKYSGVVETYNILTTKVKQGERAIIALEKALGKSKIDPENVMKIQARKAALEAVLKKYRNGLVKADPEFQNYLSEHTALTKKAAQKYPSTRIFLAAEDTNDFAHYPWLKDIITVEEKQATIHVKAMMKSYEEAVVSQGMNVITNRPYMHYSWHPEWHEARAAKYAESIGIDLPITNIPYNRFHSRTVGARPLVPDVWHSVQSYVPMAEKTLGWNSFWNTKGPKNVSWYKHMRSSTVQNNPKLRAMWNSIIDASIPARQTEVDKWANRYFNFEVFRLLSFSPSVAYKHLFKLIGTYASAGVSESVTHLPEAFKATGRKWMNNPELQNLASKIGIHPSKKGKFYDDVLRTYTYQARRSNILDDYELLPPSQISWFDNMFQNLNHHAGFMTTAIESFDRTHQFITSASMAAKRGLTARDASYAVFDGILKDNFLGGIMNPSWAKSSVVRAVMLFQTTAFKILERRLITGIQTKRALSEVMKSVKGTNWTYDKVIHEMKVLKDFIVKGEYEFKKGIITDALATERDFLGQFSARQAMREMVYAGVVLGGGAAIGHDYAHHLNHFPFLGKSQDKEPLVGLSPIARGTWDTLHGKVYGGEESEFGIVGNFLNNWLRQQGPIPQMVSKTIKVSKDDIPEIYREEGFLPKEFRYFFAIPSPKEKE